MPKFNVTVDFSLETEIEPDGIRFDQHYTDEAEEYVDDSYFSARPVECDGGSLTFIVEAQHEDEAEEKAQAIVYDGMERDDDNGFTWIVTNVSIEVELVEVPMDVVRASELVTKFLSEYPSMNPELKEAILFLLNLIAQSTSAITVPSYGMAEDSTITNRS